MKHLTSFPIRLIATAFAAIIITLGIQIQAAHAHHIGENWAGGIVVWVDVNGAHGIVADLTDLTDAAGSNCFIFSSIKSACTLRHPNDPIWYIPSQEQLRTMCFNKECAGLLSSFQTSSPCSTYWTLQTYAGSGGGIHTVDFSTCNKTNVVATIKCHARAVKDF